MFSNYKEKRDFANTPEPSIGQESASKGSLAFVIQKHAARQLHYDFRLEVDGVLKSWAVSKGPSLNPKIKHLAVMVEDHPLNYSDFEGSIPPGQYGAGQVIVWDKGTYSPDENGELFFGNRAKAEERTRERLISGKVSIHLRGEKLKGSWALVRIRHSDKNWLLIKHRDEHAVSDRDVLVEEKSVISGLTIDDLKSGCLPQRIDAKSRLRRTLHPMSNFVREALMASDLMDNYLNRPPYQRNDYLGWISGAKQEKTQQRRLAQMLDELAKGDSYMKMKYNAK